MDGNTPGEAKVVALDAITKAYPGVLANDAVSLDLAAGEIHAIVGENGAGKSTLVGALNGMVRPDSGRILLDGQEVTVDSPRQALGLGFGYVQQHFSLIPTLTVAQNVILALRGSAEAIDARHGSRRVSELGERFGLRLDPDAVVADLTVGEQQRAELLKALARGTRVLSLDEPNALLTPQEWEELEGVLRGLAQSGVGLILISHKLDEVLRLADRVSVMRRGRLVATTAARDIDEERLAGLMVGELVEAPPARPRGAAHGEVALAAKDLSIDGDRGERAVTGLDLEVAAGEVLGVAGVEGSGQVELSEALCGARRARTGTVTLAGEDITRRGVSERMDRGLGHVPADRRNGGLVASLSVEHNLVLPIVGQAPFSRFGVTRPGAIAKHGAELIERFDVRVPNGGVLAGSLSGGNQQKVVLARELSRPLRALVCCYPTWGLDLHAAASIRSEILKLAEAGVAVLYISVELDELLAVSDRILVLNRGRVSGELDAQQATSEELGLMMGGQERRAA
jgi:general nucleoside transport system ATP-binding protein